MKGETCVQEQMKRTGRAETKNEGLEGRKRDRGDIQWAMRDGKRFESKKAGRQGNGEQNEKGGKLMNLGG